MALFFSPLGRQWFRQASAPIHSPEYVVWTGQVTHRFIRVCGSGKPGHPYIHQCMWFRQARAPIHSSEYVVRASQGTHTFTRVCGLDKREHQYGVYVSDKLGSHTFIGVWGHKLLEVWVPLPRGHELKWGFQCSNIYHCWWVNWVHRGLSS